jgi:hypothetical protein
VACGPIRSQAADQGGHTAGDDVLQADLRSPGGRPTFPPASQDVNMAVYETWDQDPSGEVMLLDRQAGKLCRPGRKNGLDPLPGHHDISNAQWLRRKNIASPKYPNHASSCVFNSIRWAHFYIIRPVYASLRGGPEQGRCVHSTRSRTWMEKVLESLWKGYGCF